MAGLAGTGSRGIGEFGGRLWDHLYKGYQPSRAMKLGQSPFAINRLPSSSPAISLLWRWPKKD